MKCIMCKKELTGLQRKFCSKKCKGKYHNSSSQAYHKQRDKGIKRKLEFVKLLGGKCSCGYQKNLSAFHFHHKDSSTKSFQVDLHALGNRSYQSCLQEVRKCELKCSNCHAETHHPNLDLGLLS